MVTYRKTILFNTKCPLLGLEKQPQSYLAGTTPRAWLSRLDTSDVDIVLTANISKTLVKAIAEQGFRYVKTVVLIKSAETAVEMTLNDNSRAIFSAKAAN